MQKRAVGVISVLLSACSASPSSTPAPALQHREELQLMPPDAKVTKFMQITPEAINFEAHVPLFPTFEATFYQPQDQNNSRLLDMLIVIDNSNSMEEEQLNLSTKLASLVSNIDDRDWRINIITTDSPCPTHPDLPLKAPITQDAEAIFRDAVNIGIGGSGYEMGINMTMQHLRREKNPRPNDCIKPWLRPKALLTVLYITDAGEDESSPVGPDDLLELVKDMGYEPEETFKAYGIVDPEDGSCVTAEAPSIAYIDLIAKSGGTIGNICNEDYSHDLEAISQDMQVALKTTFPLERMPLPDSITAEINGEPIKDGWHTVGLLLIFDRDLAPGDALHITYKTEELRTLVLPSSAKVGDPMRVTVNDRVMPESEYTYEPSDHSLRFRKRLVEGGDVKVAYLADYTLLTAFAFPKIADADELECYASGRVLDFQYHFDAEQIVFSEPPPAGSTVLCLNRAS